MEKLNILKKAFDYDEKEKVTIKDYFKKAKEVKIYYYHLFFLVGIYTLILGVQAVTGEWDVIRNIVIGVLYIFLEYINILVIRRHICKDRYMERKYKKDIESERVKDG